jgi:hypothetical protein
MRSLSFAAIAIWLLAVSGCVEQHDWHRGWWDEHHRGERYEAERPSVSIASGAVVLMTKAARVGIVDNESLCRSASILDCASKFLA